MDIEAEVRTLHQKLDHTESTVGKMSGQLDTQIEIMRRVEDKQDQTNGAVAEVKRDQIASEIKQAETRGGLGMLKWIMAVLVIPVLIGAAGIAAALVFALVT